MCPTCHTTLDQSDSAAAQRIEHFIQLRIDQCATAGQIKDELVANFGAGILAAPPRKGFDLLAWWLPLGGIILGAIAVAFGVWRWSRARAPDDERRHSTPRPSGGSTSCWRAWTDGRPARRSRSSRASRR